MTFIPEIADLIPDYIIRRGQDLRNLQAYVAVSDFDKMRSISHQTKGHAASYGFPELEAIATELEAAAKVENLEGCRKSVELWAHWLNSQPQPAT